MAALRRLSLAAASVALLSTAACFASPARRFVIDREGGEGREIRIEVVNDNFADMGIFVMEGGANFRLGDVVGKTRAAFSLNPDQISPSQGLRLLADPVGSRDAYLSDPVTVGPGAVVVFNIHPDLRQSYVILR